MGRIRMAFPLALVLAQAAPAPGATPLACDHVELREAASTARSNIIDGAAAIAAWDHVLESGGVVGWTATEYNVDARSTFVFTFGRDALRVYRAGSFGTSPDEALTGCADSSVVPEAVIPWSNVREIEAGNWVVWFRLKDPVTIRSDRNKVKRVDELKAYFHGAGVISRAVDPEERIAMKRKGRGAGW